MAEVDYVAKYGGKFKTVCAAVAKPVECHLCGAACSESLERFPRSFFCGPCWAKDMDRITRRAIQERAK